MIKLMLTSDLHYGFDNSTDSILRKFFKKLKKDFEDQRCSALILGGDLASNKQKQLENLLKLAYNTLPNVPIALVLGNHDFWDADGKDPYNPKSVGANHHRVVRDQLKLFEKYGIHYLPGNPLIIDNVVILGFDGWYGNTSPGTNDMRWMHSNVDECPTHLYLSHKAFKDLDSLLQYDDSAYRKTVVVTHFPPFTENDRYFKYCANPNYFKPLKDKADFLLVGHSHQFVDRIEDECRILNCGSDYNKPKYLIFEV